MPEANVVQIPKTLGIMEVGEGIVRVARSRSGHMPPAPGWRSTLWVVPRNKLAVIY